jgi:hypothetical protein
VITNCFKTYTNVLKYNTHLVLPKRLPKRDDDITSVIMLGCGSYYKTILLLHYCTTTEGMAIKMQLLKSCLIVVNTHHYRTHTQKIMMQYHNDHHTITYIYT